MLLASCRTTRTITRNSEVDVRQRDSLVVHDSVVLRYVTATRDKTHDKGVSTHVKEKVTDSKSVWSALGTVMDIVGWVAFALFLILFARK